MELKGDMWLYLLSNNALSWIHLMELKATDDEAYKVALEV